VWGINKIFLHKEKRKKKLMKKKMERVTNNKSSEDATQVISQMKDNPNFTINAKKTTSGDTLSTRLRFKRPNSVKIV